MFRHKPYLSGLTQQPAVPATYPTEATSPFPQNAQVGSTFPANPQPVSLPLSDETSKINKPKYWFGIIGVVLAYVILSNVPIVSSLLSVLWIVIVILCVRAIIQLNKTGVDILPEKEKFKMVIYMALDPLISQALYYYILKKQMPATAKKALSIGWKTFIIQILLGALIYVALVLVVSYGGISHKAQDKKTAADYSQQVQQTGSDITKLANNIKAGSTSALLTDCQTVKDDAAKLQTITPFSAKTLADKVAQSNTILNQATNDCLTAANQSDSSLLTQSASEFAAWGNTLPDIKTELAKL